MSVIKRIKIFMGWCPNASNIYTKNRAVTENRFTFLVKSLGIFAGYVLFTFLLRGIVLYNLVWHSSVFMIIAEKTFYIPALVVLSFFSSYFGFLGRSTNPKRAVSYVLLTFVIMTVVIGVLNYVIGSNTNLLVSWKTQPALLKYILRIYVYDWIIPFTSGVFFVLLLLVPSLVYAFAVSKWRGSIALVISSVVYAFLLPTWMDIVDFMVVPTDILGQMGFYLWLVLYGLLIFLWVALFDFVRKKSEKLTFSIF